MKNPTQEELQQYSDGVLDQRRTEEINRLVQTNPGMAREIEVYRAVNRISKDVMIVHTSKNFTKKVMQSILPAQKESILMRIINNSSNVFAMIMVLCTIISIFIVSSKQTGKEVSLPGSEQYQTIVSAYEKYVDLFSQHSKKVIQPINSVVRTETKKLLGIVLVIFFGYIVLDQILSKKIFPSKLQH